MGLNDAFCPASIPIFSAYETAEPSRRLDHAKEKKAAEPYSRSAMKRIGRKERVRPWSAPGW
jgi:hypothetical protein